MSEGIVIESGGGETAGIVVKKAGERGCRLHAATRQFEPLDSHVFVSPEAARRAVRDFAKVHRNPHASRRVVQGV